MSPLDENIIDTRVQKIRSASNKLARFKEMAFDEFKNDSDSLEIDHKLLLQNIKDHLADFELFSKEILTFTKKQG